MSILEAQFQRFDPRMAMLEGANKNERLLSSLRGMFAHMTAFDEALTVADPVVYTVASIEPAMGDGDLHYGLGMLMPGRIGDEYFMTKGHLHAWRAAAEVYIGLAGEGMMLLEDEATGESQLMPLGEHSIVYVPGGTAHRTLNTGEVPLVYLGVYPAHAGHDYGTIAERNFRKVLVARHGQPTLMDREAYMRTIATEKPV
jgi:glucose-6-phosphate isomerase, archaeal